jgi:hypothetical protein
MAARRVLRILVVLVLAAVGIGTVAGPAHATTRVVWWTNTVDDFESNPASVWNFDGAGTDVGFFSTGAAYAHSGTGSAWLFQFDPGFSSVGRPVYINTALVYPSGCLATFYLRSETSTVVNVEIIEPHTWTYIALNQVTTSPTWTPYTVGPWGVHQLDVFVRVSALQSAPGGVNIVSVDDLTVACFG